MNKIFIVSIPRVAKYQFEDTFHWSLTISENFHETSCFQFISNERFFETGKFQVFHFIYENLIFDFEKGKLYIVLKDYNIEAVLAILQSLTIHFSPKIKTYCLLPRKRPKNKF